MSALRWCSISVGKAPEAPEVNKGPKRGQLGNLRSFFLWRAGWGFCLFSLRLLSSVWSPELVVEDLVGRDLKDQY